MRRNPVARIFAGAAVATLLASSVVNAQSVTPPPKQWGPALGSAVLTSALDHPSMNEAIEDVVQQYHTDLGGKKKRLTVIPSLPSTEDVVDGVIEAAQVKNNIIVISGGDGQADVGVASAFDDKAFLDLGQGRPCVTLDGQADPSGTCEGESFGIPVNYSAIGFRVEEGAYLAGVLAADASRDDRLGVIVGAPGCDLCNRYVNGFVQGARSVAPDIDIEITFLSDDEDSGFGDPASAATFTRAFIDVYRPDVLLPVGRAASVDMIEIACEAGILAVGTDIDISAVHPGLADCILTSVTRDTERGLAEAIHAFADGTIQREVSYGLVEGGVAITDEWQQLATLPVDTAEHFAAADSGLRTSQVLPCAGDCEADPRVQ